MHSSCRIIVVLLIALALMVHTKLVLASFLASSSRSPAAWRPPSASPTTRFAASSGTGEQVQQHQHSLEQGKTEALFDDFVEFLKEQQTAIIAEIESTIERNSGATFCRDTWGCFDDDETASNDTNNNPNNNSVIKSGGITRVLQGGDCIEKGACSLTLISEGILTKERAANIRARQFREGDTEAMNIQAGDTYSAAALSMVLHSRSPLVPTFRSDVRVFLVTDQDTSESWAWFGLYNTLHQSCSCVVSLLLLCCCCSACWMRMPVPLYSGAGLFLTTKLRACLLSKVEVRILHLTISSKMIFDSFTVSTKSCAKTTGCKTTTNFLTEP